MAQPVRASIRVNHLAKLKEENLRKEMLAAKSHSVDALFSTPDFVNHRYHPLATSPS